MIDVLIVGTGGTGTTNLLKKLSKIFSTNCINNTDGLKHIDYPPGIGVNKCIYIYGEPRRAIYSHYKKSNKDNSTNNDKSKIYHPELHFNQFPGEYIHTNNYKKYVEDVTICGEDLSGIYKQFQNFKKGSPNYTIFFLDFTQFNKTKGLLAEYLEIPVNKIDVEYDEKTYYKDLETRLKLETEEYKNLYQGIYEKMMEMNGKIVEKIDIFQNLLFLN